MDILTIIRVFMASTDIYCSRRQNQWDDPHPLADSLSAISMTTIYHNFPGEWQLFSRPKALWNIPAPPFSLGMDSSSWCQGKDTVIRAEMDPLLAPGVFTESVTLTSEINWFEPLLRTAWPHYLLAASVKSSCQRGAWRPISLGVAWKPLRRCTGEGV